MGWLSDMYDTLGYSAMMQVLTLFAVLGGVAASGLTALVGGARQVFNRAPSVIVHVGPMGVHQEQQQKQARWRLWRWWLLFAAIFAGPWVLCGVALTGYQAVRWMLWWAVSIPWVLPVVACVALAMGGVWFLLRDGRDRRGTDRQVAVLRGTPSGTPPAVSGSSPATPADPPEPVVWSAPGRDRWGAGDGL